MQPQPWLSTALIRFVQAARSHPAVHNFNCLLHNCCLGRACQTHALPRGMTCLLNCNRNKKIRQKVKGKKSNYELEWLSQSLLPSAAWCVRTSTNKSIKPAASLMLPLAVVSSLCSVCRSPLVPPLCPCAVLSQEASPLILFAKSRVGTWNSAPGERAAAKGLKGIIWAAALIRLVWRARN